MKTRLFWIALNLLGVFCNASLGNAWLSAFGGFIVGVLTCTLLANAAEGLI